MAGLLEESNRFEKRLQNFQAILPDELKKKHETFSVNLRREKRNETRAKKRYLIENSQQVDISSEFNFKVEPLAELYPELNGDKSLKQKFEILKSIFTENKIQSESLMILDMFKHWISLDRFFLLFHENLDENFLKVLIEYVDFQIGEQAVHDSTWIICNILSGPAEFTECFIKLGGLEKILNALSLKSMIVSEHIFWALANIAGDEMEYSILLIKKGVIGVIYEFLIEANIESLAMQKVALWCLVNISNAWAAMPPTELRKLLIILRTMISIESNEVKCYCLEALCKISHKEDSKVQFVIDQGFIPFVLRNLKSSEESLLHSSITLIGNICAGTHLQTQKMLDENILDLLLPLSDHPSWKIRKNIFWIIGNISGGTREQCEMFLDHEFLNVAIRGLLDYSYEVRLYASYIFTNTMHNTDEAGKMKIIAHNIFLGLATALADPNQEYLVNILEVCYYLLKAGENYEVNPITQLFDYSGCLDAIERAQNHSNDIVCNACQTIIENFFGVEEVIEGDFLRSAKTLIE
ncbi:unnamed protein product [Blepharisma stoltei]|uniref:Importin subunit alpha n=1 Tax=Blepharisma stoltei TaxID=1481888 RepID=A0AAU9IL51_9CILI|nr:unnamed protein product [Blepharisma stoltei]